MSFNKHPAYDEERKHLKDTIEWIERRIDEQAMRERKIYEKARRASFNYSQENSQEDIELDLNKQLYTGVVERLNRLKKSRQNPYFARVDFCEADNHQPKKLYIGRSSLLEGDQGPMVIDWRAPAANLYYDGRLGQSAYRSPDGEIKGELLLKRQLSIAEGELLKILDIDVTADDELLQDYLGINTENRLKDIVVSIQTEQNRIIRAELGNNLVVQGVAGSGKTTVALHRIAYLLYNYPEYKEESFMIIAPNKLFLDYISEVLPELGVDRVKQTTFTDLALEKMGEAVKVIESHEKLASIIEQNHDRSRNHSLLIKEASKLKSSVLFKETLDRFLEKIEDSILPDKDFGFDDGTMVISSIEEIGILYKKYYKDWPFYQRIEQVFKHLKKRLATIREEYIENCQDECFEKIKEIKAAMEDSESRRLFISKIINEKEEKIRKMEDFAKKGLQNYMKRLQCPQLLEIYKNFFQSKEGFLSLCTRGVKQEVAEFLRETSLLNLEKRYIEYEDLAPLLYIKFRTTGIEKDNDIKQIVIDEAQDYSIFQYLTLKEIFKDATFTILGDLSQGIYNYQGIEDWGQLRDLVFLANDSRLLVLNNSYRTTIEITETANRLFGYLGVPDTYKALPVIRHGAEVQIIKKENQLNIAAGITELVGEMKEAKYKSIAVICKTIKEAKEYAGLLTGCGVTPSLLTGKETTYTYTGGVVVLPSYLVKGLEFDVVFIADAGRHNYLENNTDARLLYASMTRPLHRLYIYYTQNLSGLLC